MRFLVDAQLPPALARSLVELGHEAEHVVDIGPPNTTDVVLWQYAAERDAVIVTKDEDFAAMVVLGEGSGPTVVWVRTGNTRRAQLLDWFLPLVDQIAGEVAAGQRLIELR